MNNMTRICLALAATLIAVELPAHAQELDTQILLPDPLISTTSLTPFAYGKALLVDPWPSDPRPDYQSLFLGTLAGTGSPTIWRIDPVPNATPAFSEFTVTPLDARFRFVTKLAYSKVEKALYAAGDVEVQNTKPKSTSLAWVVRQSVYDESGVAHPWSDSDTVVLVKGADSRAQGIAVDGAGQVYVCGRANDAKGNRHFLVRRKASTGSWSTVYDKVMSSYAIPETGICYFPVSPTAPAAVLMVGNQNNQWTIVRSLTGNSGTWLPVDTAWSAANSPAGAKNIAYDPQSGKIYVVGYRGTFGPDVNGWVVRVSADGGQTWSGLLDAPCPPYSYPDAVTTDAAGNVLAIGQVAVLREGNWVPQMHLVRCTNPADVLSWQTSFTGVPLPFNETNCYDALGQAITTDASGAIFATGVMFDWVDSRTSPATKYAGNNLGLLRLTPVAP
jgi:hypothetical protein